VQLTLQADLEQAFAAAIGHLAPPHAWVLAVSGGPDSTALMYLAAGHCRQSGLPLPRVLTVDHGLRPGSDMEAGAVATAAHALGLRHETLAWTGPKPACGIQQAAREARYRLLASTCEQAGASSLMTGHTRDDQIETVQMRQSRGSGRIGLAGMPSQSLLPGTTIRLVRPLLAIPKADLTTWLDAAAAPYIRDPSNADPRFDRARLRLQASQDAPDPAAVLSAQRYRMAVERQVHTQVTRHLYRDKAGIFLPRTAITGEPDEMADLTLSVLLRAVGGRDYPGTRAERARLLARLRAPETFRGATLASVHIRPARRSESPPAKDMIVFQPESGGKPPVAEVWLPFAQFSQTGFDGQPLTISTIFPVH
jgi:tRNA(Ile)-lysidine synthetase-like protein